MPAILLVIIRAVSEMAGVDSSDGLVQNPLDGGIQEYHCEIVR